MKECKITKKDVFDFHQNLMTIVIDESNNEELHKREIRYIEWWLETIGVKVVK